MNSGPYGIDHDDSYRSYDQMNNSDVEPSCLIGSYLVLRDPCEFHLLHHDLKPTLDLMNVCQLWSRCHNLITYSANKARSVNESY